MAYKFRLKISLQLLSLPILINFTSREWKRDFKPFKNSRSVGLDVDQTNIWKKIVHQSICLSVCLSVCLILSFSIYLSIYPEAGWPRILHVYKFIHFTFMHSSNSAVTVYTRLSGCKMSIYVCLGVRCISTSVWV